jgi:hypothetical protein
MSVSVKVSTQVLLPLGEGFRMRDKKHENQLTMFTPTPTLPQREREKNQYVTNCVDTFVV